MAQHKASKRGLRALEYGLLFLGVKEQPAGTNHGPSVRRRDKKGKWWTGGIDYWCYLANGVRGGYPWCAAFATSCFKETGTLIGDARRASVGFFEAWAKREGDLVTRPYRGDLACYRFDSDDWPDHIGIVHRVLALPGSGKPFLIRVLEGNTSLTNNSNGGQVMLRTRWAYRCRFVRIPD
jgi:CHAP domain-containing protein